RRRPQRDRVHGAKLRAGVEWEEDGGELGGEGRRQGEDGILLVLVQLLLVDAREDQGSVRVEARGVQDDAPAPRRLLDEAAIGVGARKEEDEIPTRERTAIEGEDLHLLLVEHGRLHLVTRGEEGRSLHGKGFFEKTFDQVAAGERFRP